MKDQSTTLDSVQVEVMGDHAAEIARRQRFEFGKNWGRFLEHLNESRICEAEQSLKEMLETDSLQGLSFLDAGCGSGLFSLAARRLGAQVRSFDFDPQSVTCAVELKRKYFPDDVLWEVEEGSVLDANYIRLLGRFDVVYSWGVLHHTGQMWTALENVQEAVADGGKLFVAIYNDTGSQTARWRWIKRTYNKLPRFLQAPFAAGAVAPQEIKSILRALVTSHVSEYVRSWTNYSDNNRGMSRWHDIIDWVGGYPYEVASPDEVFAFCRPRGFNLINLKCGGVGLGCNEFVFVKKS